MKVLGKFHSKYMKIINISKSWFYTAGKKFDWLKDGFDIKGVGIALSILKENASLEIRIDNERFLAETEPILKMVEKYNAYFTAGQTRLAIISKSWLRKIG